MEIFIYIFFCVSITYIACTMYTIDMYQTPQLHAAAVILQYSDGKIYLTLTSDQTSGNNVNWQLPSSPVFQGHTSVSSLSHQLKQTIGLKDDDVSYREQLYTTETVQDGQTSVQICYLFLSRGAKWHKGENQVGLFSVDRLPKLNDTGTAIVRYALDRLHAKALYSSIAGFLLPVEFDLNDLQRAFETITRQPVDRRNFRKKILSLNVLKETRGAIGANPAEYSFKSSGLTLFDTPFKQTAAARRRTSSKAS